MNRCARLDQKYSLFITMLATLGVAVLALLTAPAQAAGLRVFPMNTHRGEIVFTNPPQVQLDGKAEQLAPGSRVHDAANNRLVFASTLKGQTYTVNYVRDGNGTLRDIWILTPGEIRDKLPPTQEELNRIRQWQSQNIVPPSQSN
ncbi:MAG: hypothetical protein LBU72_05620 [Burkholderiaceae bacterium]|jgi:hypothetical protein|nr:hypothetical protein [Burkholderiaceae bacterium]